MADDVKCQKLDADNRYHLTDSADPHAWTNVKSITLSKCLHSITPDLIAQSKETLRDVTFSDYTLFKNIKRCLKTLSNLKHLTFLDIFVDAYHRFLYTKIIEVPSLESLSLIRTTKLTNSEYFLLDFFTRGANISNVNKLVILEQKMESETTVDSPRTASEEVAREETPFLAKFILKYRSSLKSLRTSGIKIWESLETKEHSSSNLSFVQLHELWYCMDDPAQNYIMERQRCLRTLIWEGAVHDWTKKKMDQLFMCLSNNADTLTVVKLWPILLRRGNYDDDDEIEVNCESFSRLNMLETLEIAISSKIAGSNEDGRLASLASVHLLPSNIRTLVIKSLDFTAAELQFWANRVTEFKSLQTLHLERGATYLFEFNSVWLQAFAELPSIHSVTIKGAKKVEETMAVIDHIKRTRPAVLIHVEQ